jgi:hypothetical protein
MKLYKSSLAFEERNKKLIERKQNVQNTIKPNKGATRGHAVIIIK